MKIDFEHVMRMYTDEKYRTDSVQEYFDSKKESYKEHFGDEDSYNQHINALRRDLNKFYSINLK